MTIVPLFMLVLLCVSLISWLAIVSLAFKKGDIGWGVGALLCWPLALGYGMRNYEHAKTPLIAFAISAGINSIIMLVLLNMPRTN